MSTPIEQTRYPVPNSATPQNYNNSMNNTYDPNKQAGHPKVQTMAYNNLPSYHQPSIQAQQQAQQQQ